MCGYNITPYSHFMAQLCEIGLWKEGGFIQLETQQWPGKVGGGVPTDNTGTTEAIQFGAMMADSVVASFGRCWV